MVMQFPFTTASYPVKMYTGGESRVVGSLSSQSLHVDTVDCTGAEERLDQCRYSMIEASSCLINYEAGVICTGRYTYSTCCYIWCTMGPLFPQHDGFMLNNVT